VLTDAARDRIRAAWWDVAAATDIGDVLAETSRFDEGD
jgi:hypothetical protein